MIKKYNFTTSYSQFYITDAQYNSMPQSMDLKKIDIDTRLFNNTEHFVTVYTETYSHVNGEISILEKVNEIYNPSLYDHIVESNINIKSGTIQFLDCPFSDVLLEMRISPGLYKIRVYSSNLKSVIDSDKKAKDYYKIEMWKDSTLGRVVLKWYDKNIE